MFALHGIVMEWLFGIFIVALLVFSAGFRKFAIGLCVLLALVGGVWWFFEWGLDKLSLSRIKPSELVFENIRLIPDRDNFRITGRIKNNSIMYTLRMINFDFVAQDCVSQSSSAINPIGTANASEEPYKEPTVEEFLAKYSPKQAQQEAQSDLPTVEEFLAKYAPKKEQQQEQYNPPSIDELMAKYTPKQAQQTEQSSAPSVDELMAKYAPKQERNALGLSSIGKTAEHPKAISKRDITPEVSSDDKNIAQPCVIIGQANESVYFTIPPGQARDFEKSVYFSGDSLKPKGFLEWSYSVSQLKAE